MPDPVELWREADAILDRLLDLAPDARAAALASMSLSRELRDAVARLLEAQCAGSGVLDRSPHEEPASALRGRKLGRWELEQEIGRGGMSVVYRAHAVDAPTQVAAVKLLTLGALAARGLEVFRQEQAVLARLRHAHIATLFDAGTADDGTAWLAMALVEGVRIDTWCEQRALEPRAIVRLFLAVCDAVSYAHRNLVIHRDLKPSNVLVDHDGHVRLLDFGIARLADAGAEATASQWRALTPEYAAPEQFTGAPPSTAMDVYGLGALLYRLLAGKAPRRAGASAEAEITAPSRAMQGARANVLRGDLDAVLLKALAPDPQRRHESVGALQRDLHAWLERRPVSARAPSAGYRLARFVVRNRLAVTATTAIVLALLVGSGVALWQARRANAQSQLAEHNAARATAVRDFLVSLFEAADPERAGGAVASTREIVALGAERARSGLEAEPALRAELLRVIGAIQRRLGTPDEAGATLDAAAEAAAAAGARLPTIEVAQLRYERGVVLSIAGKVDDAERQLTETLGLLADDKSAAAELLRAQVLGELAIVAGGRGDFDAAFARLDEADAAAARLVPASPYERMVVRNLRVATLNEVGRYAEASELASAIVADARSTGVADRGNFAQLLANASKLASAAGDLELATKHAEEGVRFARERYPAGHPVLADALLALGNAYRSTGRHADAAVALRDAMASLDASGDAGKRGEAAMILGRSLLETGGEREALALAIGELDASSEWEDRPATRVLGLLDVALRAARAVDRNGFSVHAATAERELASLPEEMRAQPMAQRVRRRLAQWRFDDGALADALRFAEQGIAVASSPATGDELILRAVAVRANHALRRGDAAAGFDGIVAALAAEPNLKPIEAEVRLAVAQAAAAIGRADRDDYLGAAQQAHAATPLPPLLAAQLDALVVARDRD